MLPILWLNDRLFLVVFFFLISRTYRGRSAHGETFSFTVFAATKFDQHHVCLEHFIIFLILQKIHSLLMNFGL